MQVHDENCVMWKYAYMYAPTCSIAITSNHSHIDDISVSTNCLQSYDSTGILSFCHSVGGLVEPHQNYRCSVKQALRNNNGI